MASYAVISYLSAAILGVFFILTLVQAARYLKSEKILSNRVAFLFFVISSFTFLIVDWPGIVGVDELFMHLSLIERVLSAWHSMTYSFLNAGMLVLTDRPFLVSTLNFALCVHLWILFFSITSWDWKRVSFWFLLLLVLLPPFASIVFFQSRDSTYSLFFVIFLLGVIAQHKSRLPVCRPANWVLLLLLAILADLRQEGLVVAVVSPAMMWYFSDQKKQQWALILNYGKLLIFFAFLIALPKYLLKLDAYAPVYKTTAYVSPVSHIINSAIDPIAPEVLQDIDSVIPIEIIKKYPRAQDIMAFHEGVKLPVTEENYLKFRDASIKLILENPSLYFENRWDMFKWAILFKDMAIPYGDSLRYLSDPRFMKIFEKYPQSGKDTSYTQIQNTFYTWIEKYFLLSESFIGTVFLSVLFPLLILIFLMLQVRRNSYLAWLSAIVLLRSFVVLMTMPAGYFKYFTSTWVAGWLFLFFYINDRQSSLAKSK